MPDLIDRVFDSLLEAADCGDPSLILEILKELKSSYAVSGYQKPEEFMTNKGLEIASDGIIVYKKLPAGDSMHECLALNLGEARIDERRAIVLIDALDKNGVPALVEKEVYVTDKKQLIIGISVGK